MYHQELALDVLALFRLPGLAYATPLHLGIDIYLFAPATFESNHGAVPLLTHSVHNGATIFTCTDCSVESFCCYKFGHKGSCLVGQHI